MVEGETPLVSNACKIASALFLMGPCWLYKMQAFMGLQRYTFSKRCVGWLKTYTRYDDDATALSGDELAQVNVLLARRLTAKLSKENDAADAALAELGRLGVTVNDDTYQWRVDAQPPPDSSDAASVAVPASEDLISTEPSYTERRCSGSI